MELFYVSKQGEFKINNNYVNLVPEFKRILRRKQSIKGDSEGVKKVGNFAELSYVFFMADWTKRNWLKDLSDVEKDVEARKEANLHGIFGSKWGPDKLIKEAIEKYKEIQQELAATGNSLKIARIALRQVNSILLDKLNQIDQLEEAVKILVERTTGTDIKEMLQAELGELHQPMLQLKNLSLEILNLIPSLRSANKTVADLEEIVTAELSEHLEVVGGGSPHSREIP